MAISRTLGIVIDSIDIGEADKILTIFTQKYGKIEAVAKGAGRPKSSLVVASEFLTLGDFLFYKGDMYKVNTCEVIEPFYAIRNDINRYIYASYITEIIREVLQENERNYKLLQLYLNALFCISETDKNLELVARIFEIKMLCIIGYRPQIDKCALCDELNVDYFSFEHDGFLCSNCAKGDSSAIKIMESTAKVIRYIVKANVKKVFSLEVHESVLNELKLITKIYTRDKLEKEFKTLDLLQKV